jgi:hypothetical protein
VGDAPNVTDTEATRWKSTSAASATSSRPSSVSVQSATVASEMEAAIWTAIGLLAATSLGTLFYLGSRIDALAARMDAGFGRVDARFDRVDARFDRQDGRFDALEARMDGLNSRLDAHLDQRTS